MQFTVDAFPNRTFSASVRQVRLNATTQQNVVTYDVVVAVDNPEEILMPGMTAYVNVIVAQTQECAPRAQCRAPVSSGERRRRAESATASALPRTGHRRDPVARSMCSMQGRPRAVRVGVGITDGRVTEVVGPELKDGDQIVVGTVEEPAEQSTTTLRMRMF